MILCDRDDVAPAILLFWVPTQNGPVQLALCAHHAKADTSWERYPWTWVHPSLSELPDRVEYAPHAPGMPDAEWLPADSIWPLVRENMATTDRLIREEKQYRE